MVDFAKLIRALFGQPEPELPTASIENITALIEKAGQSKTDREMCDLWYAIDQAAFHALGEIAVDVFEISISDFCNAITAQYPALTGLKVADSKYYTTTTEGLQKILTRDWSNRVPYIAERGDCDDFANRLYAHLTQYYGINTVIPVWGNTSLGYHAFNVSVTINNGSYFARLVEPQSDEMFIDKTSAGSYKPEVVAINYGSITVDPLFNADGSIKSF